MKLSQIIRLVCFVLLVLLSAAYPVSRILKYEKPSVPAKTFLFKVQGYDPADLFRGHYLQLSVFPNKVEAVSPDISFPERKGYLEIAPDAAGYAVAVKLYEKPPEGKTFLPVQHVWINPGDKTGNFKLPFDRYFVNADRAPELEKRIRDRDSKTECALKVRIYPDGSYAVDDLLINGVSASSESPGKEK